ncbi:single-stranded DNA-binding protein [Nocardioides jiangxiensis]|uniref:Single-stranded DNA-binding protein n=1 Tax=Nocardioides jiangxiensis TaxID=3064524 RepID=A0ABT9B2R8_9ACTN|nr:single-stranded DNA-binding protein [Nocardioides sp. WY-20]MDO7869032.1 single-stranded DNA-binding protein [Nocardioides sp. WY-20]
MYETEVTVQGFVGTKPELRQVGGTVVAGFRVGSTPRFFSNSNNAWGDRETNWFTVNAWRSLGEHCAASLHVGEPVIVRGRLRTQTWTQEGGAARSTFSIDAVAVGHDLSRGTSAFLPRSTARPVEESTELAQQNDAWSVDLPQVSSHGRFDRVPVDASGPEEAPATDAAEEMAPF